MIPSYFKPTTVEEALALKSEYGEHARYLGGGTIVNMERFPQPQALIDLAGLKLNQIEVRDNALFIGAGVTFQQIIDASQVPAFLKQAARQMTNRTIRHQATVGGQLGANQPSSDLIPALFVADAKVVLASGTVSIGSYVSSPGGLILGVLVAREQARRFGLEFHLRQSADITIVSIAVSTIVNNGALKNPIIAAGCVAERVVRLARVEQALHGRGLPAQEKVEKLISDSVTPITDVRGSAAFKKHLVGVLGYRALCQAVNDKGAE